MKITFVKKHDTLCQILLDKELAKLGDAFTNFVFSLAKSNKYGKPSNVRVSSSILANALKMSGYRQLLPRRTDRHTQGDAVESLVVYAWIERKVTLEEVVSILQNRAEDPVGAFTDLITTIVTKLKIDEA